MTTTKIQWTDRVWNPVRGCSKVSAGCSHCYAERVAGRFGGTGKPYEGLVRYRSKCSGFLYENRDSAGSSTPEWAGRARFIPEKLSEPLSWRKPCRVFVNSMSDLFHEDITFEQIDATFGAMWACLYLGKDATEGHEFQILTKRATRIAEAAHGQTRELGVVTRFCLVEARTLMKNLRPGALLRRPHPESTSVSPSRTRRQPTSESRCFSSAPQPCGG